MDLYDLIRICKAYNTMGWSVQRQLDDVLNGDIDECNGNALKMIEELFLGAINRYGNAEQKAEAEVLTAEITASIGPH